MKAKWVRNLSSRPLTQAQVSLLVRGLNYTVVPWYSTKVEYIVAVTKACLILKMAKVLRAETKSPQMYGLFQN